MLEVGFKTVYVKKGEIVLNHGDRVSHGFKIIKGCLKSYVADNEGKIHIVQFAPEGWFISDLNAILNNLPASLFIDAVEDSDVVLLPAEQLRLDNLTPEVSSFLLNRFSQNMIALTKRITLMLSATAEERYLDFMETYPTLLQRLPLKLIASYLRISPEYLSEIRRNITKR